MDQNQPKPVNQLTREQIEAIRTAKPQNMDILDPTPQKKVKIVVKEMSELTPEQIASLSPVRFEYGIGFHRVVLKKSPPAAPRE